ncbi:acetyltransferase [Enterococcus sp. JM4C]|uniref:DapH/DapD/GlmU-related protein n=1 Tax=Candidatus Enterococcus huntleyi TaxID=1857217 RepID=UPI00137B8AB7|nr:DapH/DapD/GlmU-related protein [Enterococcus sp. JM4C]KAF1298592.1 acetyltransferase [Enterococcus sp. JM4C]
MNTKNLQERLQGIDIFANSPISIELHDVKLANEKLLAEMNMQYHTNQEMLDILEQTTGQKIDPSTTVSQPFYSDFGGHITMGKDIFINKNVTFVDLGGITLEDKVLIGPDSRLITVNHLLDPVSRRGITVAPILVKKNAWIGANVTILPGITIGENSIIAADSTVTKDVPANVIVAGSPAKEVRKLDE